jgi:hypothetical protein
MRKLLTTIAAALAIITVTATTTTEPASASNPRFGLGPSYYVGGGFMYGQVS